MSGWKISTGRRDHQNDFVTILQRDESVGNSFTFLFFLVTLEGPMVDLEEWASHLTHVLLLTLPSLLLLPLLLQLLLLQPRQPPLPQQL